MSGEKLVAADLLRMLDDELRLSRELIDLPFWRFNRHAEVSGELDALRLLIPRVMLTLILTNLGIVEAIPLPELPASPAGES